MSSVPRYWEYLGATREQRRRSGRLHQMVRALNVQYRQLIVEIHRELAREVDLKSNVKVEYDLD